MKKVIFLLIAITSMVCIEPAFAQDGFQGSMEPIPPEIAKRMLGKTWHEGCPLPLSSMSYLTVSYWGFDDRPHEGHLIVLKTLAGETLQIFQELYQIKFAIEKIELPEVYASSKDTPASLDWKSSESDNTNGFFCRSDDQNPTQFSPHSYGIALDINPVYNPAFIVNNEPMPKAGKKYFDRKLSHKGMINEEVVAIFAKHGWKWGGYWKKSMLDYQHFQKDMDEHYVCPSLMLYRK